MRKLSIGITAVFALAIMFAFFLGNATLLAAYKIDGCGHMDSEKPYTYISIQHCQCTECGTYRNHKYISAFWWDNTSKHRCMFCSHESDHVYGALTSSRCPIAPTESCEHTIYTQYDDDKHYCRLCDYASDHNFPRESQCMCGYICPHPSLIPDGADETKHLCTKCNFKFDHTFSPDGQNHTCPCGYGQEHTFVDNPSGGNHNCLCGYILPHQYINSDATTHICSDCGASASHAIEYQDDSLHSCICGITQTHSYWEAGDQHRCAECGHTWEHAWVSDLIPDRHTCWHCNVVQLHNFVDEDSTQHRCSICGLAAGHNVYDLVFVHTCDTCSGVYAHNYVSDDADNHICSDCNRLEVHSFIQDGAAGHICRVCSLPAEHTFINNSGNHKCSTCAYEADHQYIDQGRKHTCSVCGDTQSHEFNQRRSCIVCGHNISGSGGSGSSRTIVKPDLPPVVIPPSVVIPSANLTDINDHWAKEQINRLVGMGIIEGYLDGTFQPDKPISRAEFVAILVKTYQLQGSGTIFTDSTAHWAKDYISTAVAGGIIKGYNPETFGPDDLITREQMAAVMVRTLNLSSISEATSFTDRDKISAWAKTSVVTAVRNQLINGYPDNTFRPQIYASRAEAVQVIMNAQR